MTKFHTHTKQQQNCSITPEHVTHFHHLGMTLKIPSLYKPSSCFHSYSRTAISTSS